MDVDFANELCRRIERRYDFKILQWDGIVAAVASGTMGLRASDLMLSTNLSA